MGRQGQRLLCVVAHPDDECFAFGGVLALAAAQGVTTSVLCLTDGQAATNRGEASSPAALGQIRRSEFRASCIKLGVTHHEVLDYQDGQLERADFREMSKLLVQRIRSFRPEVILTFGGDGGLNTHVDHTMVSCFATAAFHWAGRESRFLDSGPVFQPSRLFYSTTSFFLPRRQQPLPSPWTATVDTRSVVSIRIEAFNEHVSQRPVMDSISESIAEYGGVETFTLAASAKPGPATQMRDLFDDL